MSRPSPTKASRYEQPTASSLHRQKVLDGNTPPNKAGLSPVSSANRQPFGTRNVMPSQHTVHRVDGDEKPAHPPVSTIHPQQQSHGRLHASRTLKPSSYAAHAPSPLGSAPHRQQAHQRQSPQPAQHEEQENVPPSPSATRTPRKRAIPLEDVHCRNVVAGDAALSPNPHKRSRSSRNDSSAPDASTSTSMGGISAAINDVHLRSQGAGGSVGGAIEVTANANSLNTAGRAGKKDRSVSNTTTTAKTVRIDKQSRLTQNDRLQREQSRTLSTMEWRKRFLRAFPSFRFYLDGFEQSAKTEVATIIVQLGGNVEPFFSHDVTHLVTSRKVSLPLPSEQTASEQPVGASVSASASTGGTVAERISGTTTTLANRAIMGAGRLSRLPTLRNKKATAVPLHSERNPFDEWGPPVKENDILVKARNFGIKVWTYDKFKTVMAGLVGDSTVDPKKQPNLSQMLAKEKVQGTQERDPKVARTDYHYFSRNSIYLLIEDATAEHRPIMVQEWRKPGRDDDEVPWPVLYGELEGRCPFTKFQIDGDPRKRVRPNRHETLQRSVSLNHVRSQQRNASLSPAPSNDSRGGYSIARGASPYPLASGNSISIASTNIASTTSAAATNSPAGLGLLSPFHPMGRKAYPATGIGMGHPTSLPRSASANAALSGVSAQTPAERVRGSLVRRMLGMTQQRTNAVGANGTSSMRRSVSTASAALDLRREKKPGYCENCRMKYEDFDDHIVGRRHRKFAQDDGNFSEIDELLRRVNRSVAPWAVDLSCSDASSEDRQLEDEGEFGAPPLDDYERHESGDEYDDEDASDDPRSGSDGPVLSAAEHAAAKAGMAPEEADSMEQAVNEWQRATLRREAGMTTISNGEEGDSASSPGAPSFGIPTAQLGEQDVSPHTSPQMAPHDQLAVSKSMGKRANVV